MNIALLSQREKVSMKIIRGYPEYMRESIERVEQTRSQRVNDSFPPMSLAERDTLLREFHPDFKLEQKRPIAFGPSAGMMINTELADLIESHPVVPSTLNLSQVDYDVDVLIVGGGGAGTVAAIWAAKEGIHPDKILIATKLRHGDSNSTMAQGGIQAADRQNDSPIIHYLDAMGGGHFTNNPELVKTLVSDAPRVIKWHEDLGVMYDKDEQGNFFENPGGGTSRKRLHSAKDYTGLEIMRVIRDEARNLSIPVVEFAPVVELLMDDHGQVAGGVLLNLETREYLIVRAKATILASGGFGRLHMQGFPTTNHYGATADGLIMAYHAGAELVDLDSVQYHPTGAAFPPQIAGLLITEKVRGLGAAPVNDDGELFVYPLEPRDVESSAFIRECYHRNKGVATPTGMRGVWLDSPMVEIIHGEGTIKKALPAMWRMYQRFGIDMTQDPILVFPTLHYQNGGVVIDTNGQTTVPGLFAGGEVGGGVHGKNRLMGNSLLDFNVFGMRAGIAAARHAKQAETGTLTLAHVDRYEQMMVEAGVQTERTAPILLPEYRGKAAIERHLDVVL
jgi:succinate dehydrogenase / fumarate reductase flavoprotein subunit